MTALDVITFPGATAVHRFARPAAEASPAGAPEAVLLDAASGDRLLTTKAAAALLGLSPRTLEGLRRRGGGPQFIAISRNVVRYRRDDLDAWVASRAAPHTAKARQFLVLP